MSSVVLTTPTGGEEVLTANEWASRLPQQIADAAGDVATLTGLILTAVDCGIAAHIAPAVEALRPLAGDDAEAAVAIAAYHLATGDRAEAVAGIERLMPGGRGPAPILLARAKLYAGVDDDKNAERLLDAALDVDANHAGTVALKIARGLARGDLDGARAAMRAIAKRPTAWLAHLRLASLAEPGAARNHLDVARRASHDAPHVIGLCLRILVRRGEAQEALSFMHFDPASDVDTMPEEVVVPLLSALVATERMAEARVWADSARSRVNDRLLLSELGEIELILTRGSVDANQSGKVVSVPTSAPLYGAVLADLAPAITGPTRVSLLSFSLARGPEQEAPTRDAAGVPHASTEDERLVRGLPLWLADKLADAGIRSAVSTTLASDAGFYTPTAAWTLPLFLAFSPAEFATTGGLVVSGHVSAPSPGMVSISLAAFDLDTKKQHRTPAVVGTSFEDAAQRAFGRLAKILAVSPPNFLAAEHVRSEIGALADLQALFFVASKTLGTRAAWHSVRALDSLTEALLRSPTDVDTVKRGAAGYACALGMDLGGRDAFRDALQAAAAHHPPLAPAISQLVRR